MSGNYFLVMYDNLLFVQAYKMLQHFINLPFISYVILLMIPAT